MPIIQRASGYSKKEMGERRRAVQAAGKHIYNGSQCPKCGLTERYTSSGSCVACTKRRSAQWQHANPIRSKVSKQKAYKRYYWKNPARWREKARIDRLLKIPKPFTDASRKSLQEWKEKNPGAVRERLARYRTRRGRISRDWLERSGQYEAMKELYETANIQGMHVDHIVPVSGCRICKAVGLHVLANLRVYPAGDNWSKSNRCDECFHLTKDL
jgi:hypothetical protein